MKNASLGKTESRSRGQVTYHEGTISSRSTPLNPYNRVSTKQTKENAVFYLSINRYQIETITI